MICGGLMFGSAILWLQVGVPPYSIQCENMTDPRSHLRFSIRRRWECRVELNGYESNTTAWANRIANHSNDEPTTCSRASNSVTNAGEHARIEVGALNTNWLGKSKKHCQHFCMNSFCALISSLEWFDARLSTVCRKATASRFANPGVGDPSTVGAPVLFSCWTV